MSISDQIVVMKDGVVQQTGAPQAVYDDPANLFVAKFLGSPQINVFQGAIQDGRLLLDGRPVLEAPGVSDREVWAGVRPEGFSPDPAGPLACGLRGVEVMGRDVSVVASHPASLSPTVRAIISAERREGIGGESVRFSLLPRKVFLFDRDTERRIPLGTEAAQ